MEVVMVVTPEGPRMLPPDGHGHGGDPRGAQEDTPGWTWSWWSPRSQGIFRNVWKHFWLPQFGLGLDASVI